MENTKVFSGGKPVIMQINSSIDRLKEIANIIENSDKDPEIYLREKLFKDALESEYILNNTYFFYGEDAIKNFHIDFIQKVLKVLNTNLSFDDITLETFIDEDGYYIIQVFGYFMEEAIPILNIYPYFKKFEILDYDRLLKLKSLEKDKLKEVNEYKEKISFLQKCYSNPALYADGNVKLFIKMSNKKQREAILNEDLNQTNIYLKTINNELLDIQDEIHQIEDTLASIYISRDRYIERLKNRYKYENISNEKEIFNDEREENNLFFNSIEDNSMNKDFFQNMMENDESNDNFEESLEFFS